MPIRIYAINVGNKEYKVHGCYFEDNEWKVASCDENGKYHDNSIDDDLDLIEVGKYDNIQIDDKVLAWNDMYEHIKDKRHFAGLTEDRNPRVWINGKTSFTAKGFYEIIDNCELYIEDKENK